MTLLLTIGPFVGFLIALPIFWGRGISGLDLGIMIFTYVLTAGGITVGFHRHFTHGAFDAGRGLRIVLAVAGSLAIEGSVISWVTAHRRHHAYADKQGDPHSPHLQEAEGFFGVLKGLWHAHVGWLLDQESNGTHAQKFAPDMLRDPDMVKIDRAFAPLAIASFVIPALIGLVVTRTLWGAFTAFLWGAVVRAFLVHHVTWSINSICHFYGRRPFEAKDQSTNNWPLAVLSLGESWHNNHHAFPTSAKHGLRWWQIDIGGMMISALRLFRLVRNVRIPSREQMAAKRRVA